MEQTDFSNARTIRFHDFSVGDKKPEEPRVFGFQRKNMFDTVYKLTTIDGWAMDSYSYIELYSNMYESR